jgi:Subtilase family/Proprotein convertase P-domain
MLCGVAALANAMGARPPPPSSGPASKPAPAPVPGAPDPLFPLQWVLKNGGQSLYPAPMTRGIDLNVFPVYAMGITGKGVKVMLLDDGLDTHHEDLEANIDRTLLHSLVPDPLEPEYVGPGEFDDRKFRRGTHGTAMAGIIGAVANNGVGGRGVAPGVTLGAVQMGVSSDISLSREQLKQAYGGAPFSRDIDIFNGSYGFEPWHSNLAVYDADGEVQALAQLLAMRDGKGAIAVRSAGNNFRTNGYGPDCEAARTSGLACVSAEFYPVALSPQAVMVGSIDATGRRAPYSNSGANLLVAGLGGDFGAVEPGALRLGVMTTDVSGCERGASSYTPEKYFGPSFDAGDYTSDFTSLSDFERPGRALFQALNRNCSYMSTANGTSAAAATITGVVALMLEANPDLTWRDVRAILARTSRRVDAARASTRITLANGELYEAEPGWLRNGAGLWFHNWYGYGLADAAAAVKAAQTWRRHLAGPMEDTGWLGSVPGRANNTPHYTPVEIPAGAAGGGSAIHVDRPGRVEFVQIQVAFDGLAASDAAVELHSPSGMRSVLLTPHSTKSTSNAVELMLASNAFFSERMDGDWTLRLVNARAPKSGAARPVTDVPRLLGWSLRLMGS